MRLVYQISQSIRASMLLVLAACGSSGSVAEYPTRSFPTSEWDTVLTITSGINDTTLLAPSGVALWDDRLMLFDGMHQRLSVFTKAGDHLWTIGRRGRGPGEFGAAVSFTASPAGHLWILDANNRKIMEVSVDGSLQGEISLSHFPVAPTTLVVLEDGILFTTQSPPHAMIRADPNSFQVTSTGRFPWPEELDRRSNLALSVSRQVPRSTGWVAAFRYGPGFMVMKDGTGNSHPYIDNVPFARKVSPALREAGGDSARFGARSTSYIKDEIFILFGGRPKRRVHPAEPTHLIDVYGDDGIYRRSYHLPVDAKSMETEDGITFYISTLTPEGLPLILGLRPR